MTGNVRVPSFCKPYSSTLTPSLRSFTRSTTTNSLGSIFVFNLSRSQCCLSLHHRVSEAYHFVNVFCWTVIHFCCSANAIFVKACSCGGSMAFNPWSAGKLLVWNRFFLPRGLGPGFESLRFARFVNCFERIASLCEVERSRRTLMLFAGDGGEKDEGVLITSSTELPASARRQSSPFSLAHSL